MSRKLVTTIQDIQGIPGKHKRVLLAWAAFANNDGTNIFASKERVAQKAGIGRWTVYRNTEDLLKARILVQAASHTCKIDSCSKGGNHYSGKHGRYTVVYNIDQAKAQNAETYLLLKPQKDDVAKQQKVGVAKPQKDDVAKCDATQALDTTPVALADRTHPAVTLGERHEMDRMTAATPPLSANPEPEVFSVLKTLNWQNFKSLSSTEKDHPCLLPGQAPDKCFYRRIGKNVFSTRMRKNYLLLRGRRGFRGFRSRKGKGGPETAPT